MIVQMAQASTAPRAGLAIWAGRVQEASAYTLLFLLPFSKAAIEVAFFTWWAGWLLRLCAEGWQAVRPWSMAPSRRPLAVAIAAFLAVSGASVLWSHYPEKSLDGLIGKWLEYLWLFMMAVDLGARPGVLSRCAAVLAVSSGFVVLEAISQLWVGQGMFRHYPLLTYGRETGPYENPIDLATYLLVVCPLVIGLAVHGRGLRRVGYGALAAVLVVVLVRTETLGAWLALAAASAVVLALALRERMPAWLLWVGVVASAVAGAQVALGWGGALRTDLGATDRWAMWQGAFGMIRERPLLGHGLNTFMANYLDYWVAGERQPRYAHNCYLQVAAETGLVGLAAFLAVLGLMFRRILAGVERLAARREGVLLGGAVALLAFILQAAIDTNFYALRQAALFWVLAGLVVGCREQERPA